MKFIDFFAGIGGFRRGMELAGHECVGFCEWDRYAAASYTSMHLITDIQRKYLSEMPMKDRQEEILKEEYRNGEWYANDIRNVRGSDLPRADCWGFGAPCQDFSIIGTRAGLEGGRSSLVGDIFRILGEIRKENRPRWLIYENVVGMLSSNKGFDFLAILLEFYKGGYDVEWQIFNSKDYGVPQSRERVYVIGYLGEKCKPPILPFRSCQTENSIIQIGKYKYDGSRDNPSSYRVYSPLGLAPTLTAAESISHCPFIPTDDGNIRRLTPKEFFRLQGWSDEYFEKAKFVNNDNQLYKQAGNGITVNVVEAIANFINIQED